MLEGIQRLRIPVGSSKREIAVIDWGGEGQLALLHHANGFCAALWEAIALDLARDFRVFAMDARGHGDSDMPEDAGDFEWPHMIDDVIAVAEALLEKTGSDSIGLGLGHSFGGTLTLAAAAKRPGLYQRAALIDPVIFPKMTQAEAFTRYHETGLSERARRRRMVFESRESARLSFATKPLFANWQARALDLYVGEAMRHRADGQVELKCSGEAEAAIFEGAHTLDIFAEAEKATCPVRIFHATTGSFPEIAHREIAERISNGSIESIDSGHLVPMESPELVTRAVRRFLEETQVNT